MYAGNAKYTEIFVSAITHRKQALLEAFIEKKKIDKELRKDWESSSYRKKMMRIIGEDHLLRHIPGQKKSIRHLLWKLDKGFKIFVARREELFQNVANPEDPNHLAEEKTKEYLAHLVELCNDQSENLDKLKRTLKFQYGALKHNIPKQYKKHVEIEKEILTEIRRIDLRAGELKTEIIAFVKILYRELKSTGYFSRHKFWENHAIISLVYVLLYGISLQVAFAPEGSYFRDQIMRLDPSLLIFAGILGVTVPALIYMIANAKLAEKWRNSLYYIETRTKMHLHSL